MVTNNTLFSEEQSITRPPMFNRVNFVSWRERVKIFLQSIDIELWYIVNERPYATTILDADLDRFRPKLEMNWVLKTKLITSLMPRYECFV